MTREFLHNHICKESKNHHQRIYFRKYIYPHFWSGLSVLIRKKFKKWLPHFYFETLHFFYFLNDLFVRLLICMETGRQGRWLLAALSVPKASQKEKKEKEEATDSSLDSVQRLHFTSSAQGQSVAARTAGVKRLSAPQQKQLVFPNNQGLVGVLQRCRDRGTRWNCILSSCRRPPTPVSSS